MKPSNTEPRVDTYSIDRETVTALVREYLRKKGADIAGEAVIVYPADTAGYRGRGEYPLHVRFTRPLEKPKGD